MSPYEEASRMVPELDDCLTARSLAPTDHDYIVVQSDEDLERLGEDILGERSRPIIGMTMRAGEREPVLGAHQIRGLVGAGVRIYLVAEEELLDALRGILGSRLRLDAGSVRIWWPGASKDADPADHPVVTALIDEDPADTLAEFEQEFDLSRPLVRRRVRTIDDARAFLEYEIARLQEHSRGVEERLRDTQIECHRLRIRAEAAEASLAADERPAPEPG